MRHIFKLFFKGFLEGLNQQSPRHSSPEKVIDYTSPVEAKAPSGYAAKALIEGFPKAKVMFVIDGDTVIVTKGWDKIKIRLDSIDCPEDGQHWGDTATYGLKKLVNGRNVHLEVHGIDCHGRTLATIYVQSASGEEWINVNERMVTLGHAWVMRRFYDHLPKDRQGKLNRLEHWARSKKVGLWRTQNPIPPWQWRNGS
ncbi:thermonuclease family protein [Phyllobacterium pellucidum]|uniref:thermonuclease family protein n=1 Tax=Phyllobacterium pellucidum TaxID=2740464 RepID=UPI001D14F3BA|nr:thermonuclease family protein [Phyllobacterium sp. T1018]UGY08642.1 thermonuclease family protein [Phyllobacterium sp. T1018]